MPLSNPGNILSSKVWVSVKCSSSFLRKLYDKCPPPHTHTLIPESTLHPHIRKSKRENDTGSKKLLVANMHRLAFKYFMVQ